MVSSRKAWERECERVHDWSTKCANGLLSSRDVYWRRLVVVAVGLESIVNVLVLVFAWRSGSECTVLWRLRVGSQRGVLVASGDGQDLVSIVLHFASFLQTMTLNPSCHLCDDVPR